jgi:uncharacterized protein
MVRAVLNTNVIVGAFISKSNDSPNQEVIKRLQNAEFISLYSEDIIMEYVELLRRKNIDDPLIRKFLKSLIELSESVFIQSFHVPWYPEDPDDICFLLCAVNGQATHLVSHDKHLLNLDGRYEFSICKTVPFLEELRR